MPSKKVKPTNTNIEKPEGKGKDHTSKALLLDLPLDIIWEFCRFLDPPDLIYLARICKLIRSFLKGPKSVQIWRNSMDIFRVEKELPPCPSFLSELQFIRLAFHKLCHGCWTKTSDTILWRLRARYCEDCLKVFTTTEPKAFLSARLRSLSNNLLYNIIPVHSSHSYGQDFVRRWLVSDLTQFSQQLISARLLGKRQVIMDDWRKYAIAIRVTSCVLEDWENKMNQIKAHRLRAIKTTRVNGIIEYLQVLGWSDELHHAVTTPYRLLMTLEQVNQPTELTTQEWETICPQVVEFMKHCKTKRLYREYRDSLLPAFVILQKTFWEFKRSHVAKGDLCPRLIDVCLEPEIRDLMDVATPVQDLREQLLSYFPSICGRWHEFIESRLLEWISNSTGCPKEDSTFQLASVIFRCSTCGDALSYPAVLAHGCLNAVVSPGTSSISHDYNHVAVQIVLRHPFSVDVLDLNTWSEKTSRVIQLLGLDPKVATYEQLDQANARFTCESCNENGRRKIMTWTTALYHYNGQCHQRLKGDELSWEPVSDEEVSKAKELESATERMVVIEAVENNLHWACDFCDDNFFKGRKSIKDHLYKKHSVHFPTEGDHYYHVLGTRPSHSPVTHVLLISDKVRLRPWERAWLSKGRAALYDFASAS